MSFLPVIDSKHLDAETNMCNIIVYFKPMRPTENAFSDLTGRFLHCSSQGIEYILVVYHYDSNVILVESVKNCQAAELTIAWEKLNAKLKR